MMEEKASISEDLEREYEVGFLLKEEEGKEEVLRVLSSRRAKVVSTGTLKPLQLSYKIKKQSQGYFGYIRFTAHAEDVAGIEDELKKNQSILRVLMVKLPRVSKVMVVPQGEAYHEAPRPRHAFPQQQSLPLSNEALEKKIEEILQ